MRFSVAATVLTTTIIAALCSAAPLVTAPVTDFVTKYSTTTIPLHTATISSTKLVPVQTINLPGAGKRIVSLPRNIPVATTVIPATTVQILVETDAIFVRQGVLYEAYATVAVCRYSFQHYTTTISGTDAIAVYYESKTGGYHQLVSTLSSFPNLQNRFLSSNDSYHALTKISNSQGFTAAQATPNFLTLSNSNHEVTLNMNLPTWTNDWRAHDIGQSTTEQQRIDTCTTLFPQHQLADMIPVDSFILGWDNIDDITP